MKANQIYEQFIRPIQAESRIEFIKQLSPVLEALDAECSDLIARRRVTSMEGRLAVIKELNTKLNSVATRLAKGQEAWLPLNWYAMHASIIHPELRGKVPRVSLNDFTLAIQLYRKNTMSVI